MSSQTLAGVRKRNTGCEREKREKGESEKKRERVNREKGESEKWRGNLKEKNVIMREMKN